MSVYSFTGLPPRFVELEFEDFKIRANTGPEIFNLFRIHYERVNGRLPADWEEQLWLKIKEKYPKYVTISQPKAPRLYSLYSALNFFRFVKKGGLLAQPVEKAEAVRRAAICMACPMKSQIGACPICKAALAHYKVDKAISVPDGCLACGCYMPAKIWVKRDLLGSQDDYPYSETCWMREA